MDRFTSHRGIVLPLMRDNIDTDQIMPKQFLTRTERSGFGKFVFYDWRFGETGKAIPDFALNMPRYTEASVLIAGNNFGCGSSREHAPWGLYDYGFKVIIAGSFADIFYNNCFKTGILPIDVPSTELSYLNKKCEKEKDYAVSISLEDQTLADDTGWQFLFDIEPFRKYCLQEGLDDIGLTERYEKDISRYEAVRGF